MDEEFSDFKITVAETNRADKVALECARDVLKRATEVHPSMRGYLIACLVMLISESEADVQGAGSDLEKFERRG